MKKVLLMILDGWGIGKNDDSNAIFLSKTPNISRILEKYPHSQLLASGNSVGLPEGVMGNSEVGHLNIGSGRVLYQDLVRINLACKDNSIYKNPKIVEAFSYAKENSKAIHLIGLVSDGGVHSMDTHIYKLCDVAKEYNVENLFIHAITDGRDTDPKSGLGYINKLIEHLKTSNGKIASLIGRYYAMDRDKRWERIKEAYDLYTAGTGEKSEDVLKSIQASYDNGVTDEFIKPTVITKDNQPIGLIKEGDVVICVNYRTDRLRELTIALTQERLPEYDMTPLSLKYYTMTRYDDSFKDVNVIYDKENLNNTLGEIVSKNNLKQLRIAETEKYAHVTFFFSGGREKEFDGERRVLIPSPKVATYDLKPEMSANEVKDAVITEIKKQDLSFICLNFANADMVGHTGIMPAIEKAVETVDTCAGEVINIATKNGFDILIIADHGNADFTVNEDGTPNTAHTLNPVPCILISNDYQEIKDGILADVAPTILKIMGLDIPTEMTGKPLI